jgi:Anti-sigma-K factor rskA, C-terminal
MNNLRAIVPRIGYNILIRLFLIKVMMNSNGRLSSSNTRTAGVIVSFIALSFTISGVAQAQQINIDVTKPASDKPFGGEKVGTISITPDGHSVHIAANLTTPPSTGKVYEGWFVDAGGSGYKLSLGEFGKNGTLQFDQQMVNPYTYTQFIVTEEPFEDADPNAADAIGGAQLQAPFQR